MVVAGSQPGKKPVRVFISYSHGPGHSERVRAFACALREHGLDVELDQFHEHEIIDWPRWCTEQTSRQHSDFVLCVCTDEYCRRIEGNVPPEKGKGVYWEGNLLDDDIYDAKGNRRLIPILFDDEPEASMPRFLRGWTFCRLRNFTLDDSGYENLLRILTGQPRVVKPPPGPVPVLLPQWPPTRTQGGAPMPDSRETERSKPSEDSQMLTREGPSPAAGVAADLKKLEDVCKALSAYLTGYNYLLQMSDFCASCERELGARRKEVGPPLREPELWERVDKSLLNIRGALVGVKESIRGDILDLIPGDGGLRELIESFDRQLAEVTQAIDARLDKPRDIDYYKQLATNTVQHLRHMNRQASETTERSKLTVNLLLHEMEGLVRDIRLYIRFADKEARKPIGQVVGDLEAKRREEQTEATRASRQPLKGSPPSKEARADADHYYRR